MERWANNQDLAVTRFKPLEKKFKKNPNFHELYKTQIKEYLELGQAKQLTRKESRNASVVTNYIPHHGVMNIHKSGQVRVIFYASAKYQRTSLNENLLSGIDFLNNLVNIITKFWTGKYAIIGDIDKIFHQVRVCESDIDALHFVWREKPEDQLLDYAMLVHLFGKVDSTWLANWSIKKAADNASPDANFAINSNFYMGDFLKTMSNENELVKLVREVVSVLNSCGFRLNKFISSSAFVLESSPKTEISSKYVNLDLNSLISERRLGLIWNIENDTFTFKPATEDLPDTKRGILSIVSSVFEPLDIDPKDAFTGNYLSAQKTRKWTAKSSFAFYWRSSA